MYAQSGFKLAIESGPNAGQEFPVSNVTTIGRSSRNNVVLSDGYVSRRHAEIHYSPGTQPVVQDMQSLGGVFVNGNRVSGTQVLQPGDRIKLGETILLFAEGAPVSPGPGPNLEEGIPVAAPSTNRWLLLVPVGALVIAALIYALGQRPSTVTPTTPIAGVPPVATSTTRRATSTAVIVVATATPVPVAAPTPDCPTPLVCISSPLPEAKLRGVVEVWGTAAIKNFGFYKLEFAALPDVQSWSVIGDVVRSPIQDGRLAVWDTSRLPAGEYMLRLTAVDNTGNFPEPSKALVHISR